MQFQIPTRVRLSGEHSTQRVKQVASDVTISWNKDKLVIVSFCKNSVTENQYSPPLVRLVAHVEQINANNNQASLGVINEISRIGELSDPYYTGCFLDAVEEAARQLTRRGVNHLLIELDQGHYQADPKLGHKIEACGFLNHSGKFSERSQLISYLNEESYELRNATFSETPKI